MTDTCVIISLRNTLLPTISSRADLKAQIKKSSYEKLENKRCLFFNGAPVPMHNRSKGLPLLLADFHSKECKLNGAVVHHE